MQLENRLSNEVRQLLTVNCVLKNVSFWGKLNQCVHVFNFLFFTRKWEAATGLRFASNKINSPCKKPLSYKFISTLLSASFRWVLFTWRFLALAVALCLASWTSDLKVRVRALAGSLCCVLGQEILLSQCLSPPRSINGYQQTVRETSRNAGGYLRWTSIPSRKSSNTPSCFMLRKLKY